MKIFVTAASALVIAGCSSNFAPAAPAPPPPPPGVTIYYAPPEIGRQNRDVFLVNNGSSTVSVRVRITIMNSNPQPQVQTFSVAAHDRRYIGGTCAGDIWGSTACGSNIDYRIL